MELWQIAKLLGVPQEEAEIAGGPAGAALSGRALLAARLQAAKAGGPKPTALAGVNPSYAIEG